MNETKKNIRIDSYDFFGYLVPGFLLFIAICAAHIQIVYKVDPRILNIASYDFGQHYYPFMVMVVVSVVIISYILGHAVATVASFFYERMIVKHIWGYPYERLLSETVEKQNSSKYKSITVMFYLYITLLICSQLYLHDIIKYCESPWNAFLVLLITFFVLMAMSCTSGVSKFLSRGFSYVERKFLEFVGKGKPFPIKVRKAIEVKFQRDFKMSTNDVGTEIFWATYWKIIAEHEHVKAKIDKWLVLYSFMRNVGTSLLVSAYVLCVANIFGNGVFSLFVHTAILLAVSILMIIRYYYLYYSYYTKSVFRAYAFLDDSNSRPKKAARISSRRKLG